MSRRPLTALALCLFAIGAAIAGAQNNPSPGEQAQSTKPAWLSLSTVPGSYRTDIALSLSSTEEGSLRYRLPGTPAGRFITYREPILLTALPGEGLIFPLQIQLVRNDETRYDTEITYAVDKRAPEPPLPSLKPGYYRAAQDLTFVPEKGVRIHAWMAGAPADQIGRVWDGKALALTAERSLTASHLVLAYSEDAAGNQSALSAFRYSIGPAIDRVPSLNVVSPVSGTFANQQLLDIDASGVSVIRYTLDGSDPLTEGRVYDGPALVPGTGRIVLTVSAVPDGAEAIQKPDSVLRKQVVFEQMSGDPLRLAQGSSRIIHTPLSLRPIPGAHYSYLVDDATDAADALPFNAPITLSPTAGTLKIFVLRLLPDAAPKLPESRYTFILDGRVPPEPAIDVDYSLARDGVPLVTIEHDSQTQVYVTADGTQPDAQSNLYGAPFYPSVGENPVILKARARFDDGSSSWSEPVTRTVKIDAAVPPAPKAFWISGTDTGGSSAFFRVEAADGDNIRYRILRLTSPNDTSDAVSTAHPSASWPLLPSSRNLLLGLPYGTSEQVQLTFVAVSHSGIMSVPVSLSTTLDAVPPEEPNISVRTAGNAATVEVTGNETLLASVSSSPADPGADTRGFIPIAEPTTGTGPATGTIELSGREGILTTYLVRAASRGPRGLASDEAVRTVTVDRRSASLPPQATAGDPALTSAQQINVIIRHDGEPVTSPSSPAPKDAAPLTATKSVYVDLPQGVTVRYTVSDSGSGPLPTVESPLAPPLIQLSGIPGKTTEFDLQLLPVLDRDGTTVVGPVRLYRFLLDNQSPPAPRVEGVGDGAIYSNAVAAGLAEIPVGDTGYILIEEGGAKPSEAASERLFSDGHRYSVPLIRAGRAGEIVSYSLFAGTMDAAGNRSAVQTLHFSVDSTLPALPAVTYSEQTASASDSAPGSHQISDGQIIISHTPVSVQFTTAAGAAGGSIEYAVLADADAVGYPGVDLQPAPIRPVTLSAPEAGTQVYRLLAVARNAAGEKPQLLRALIYIDRQAPIPPDEPRVTTYIANSREEGFLSWRIEGSADIRYSLEPSAEAGSTAPDFSSYDAPVHWTGNSETGNQGLRVRYYAHDIAGGRSQTAVASIMVPSDHPFPVLAGVEGGAVYAEAVHIVNRTHLSGDATVRYQLSEGDGPAASVTPDSPELPGTLSIDAVPGEDVHYQIQAQTFSSSGRSPLLRLAFAIDRKPPQPPLLSGAENGGYYQESRTVSLAVPGSDSARIFYRISRSLNADPQSTPVSSPPKTSVPAASDFVQYQGPVTLDAVKNGLVTYTIDAYAEDAAGNRSRSSGPCVIYIDREVIYVSADAGAAGASGSRERPLRSIEKAITMARSTGRSTLFVASGNYPVDSPIGSTEALRIVGGLDPKQWQSTSVPTVIRPSDRFPRYAGVPLFSGSAGNGAASSEALLSVLSGSVHLKNVELAASGVPLESLLSVSGGNLRADGVDFRVDGLSQGFLQFGGTADFSDCRFERSTGSKLPVSSEPYRLLYSQDARRITMTGCSIDPGSGVNVGALRIVNGSAVISDSSLRSGTGSLYASAIELSGGDAMIRGGKIAGDQHAATAIGVAADRARVQIEGTEIDAKAASGAIGISGSDARIAVNGALFLGGPARDFSYLVNAIGGSVSLTNSVLRAGDSGDSVVVVSQSSSVAVLQNTIRAGRGSHLEAAFELIGGNAAIANNLLLAPVSAAGKAAKSAAIVLSAADGRSAASGGVMVKSQAEVALGAGPSWNGRLVCRTNGFGGWSDLLSTDQSLELLWHPPGYRETLVETALQLDALSNGTNTVISGNGVQSGDLLDSDRIHLRAGAAAIGAGSDPSTVELPGFSAEQRATILKNVATDWDGQSRPRTSVSGGAQWDLGADQFGAR